MKAHDKNIIAILITVLCVAIRITHCQIYLLTFGQNHHNYYNGDSVFNVHSYSTRDIFQNRSSEESYESEDISSEDNNINSTTNINKINSNSSIVRGNSSVKEMDLVTVVWYVATFMALATFFLLMTCPNRNETNDNNNNNNNSNNHNGNDANNGNEFVDPSLTPTPSYSEFAPPSYETVMKEQYDDKANIFYIPINSSSLSNTNNNSSNPNNHNNNIIPTATVNFYIINEIGKF